MKLASNQAHEDFLKENPTLFCMAFIRVDSKYDVVGNNMVETFSGYTVHVRAKHCINISEDTSTATFTYTK